MTTHLHKHYLINNKKVVQRKPAIKIRWSPEKAYHNTFIRPITALRLVGNLILNTLV